METVKVIGFDIAKSVFQVHGIDAEGKVIIRRQLKRRYVLSFFKKLPPCLVGMEACASSHYWSRELQALGHTVRLMPAAYVKPYVKRHKNDATDAEAICEAVTRPNMRFVATKTSEQQSCLVLHRTRQLFIRQQTAVINAIRAHLAEFGIVAPVGRKGAVRPPDALPPIGAVAMRAFLLGAMTIWEAHCRPSPSGSSRARVFSSGFGRARRGSPNGWSRRLGFKFATESSPQAVSITLR
jgi:hypothetical protein